MKYSKVKKINPNDDLVIIEFITAKKSGRGGGQTTDTVILPKVLADMVDEK